MSRQASATSDINFDTTNILDYFIKYAEKQYSDNSRSSYKVLIEEFRNNLSCFYTPNSGAPRGKAYGKVTYPKKLMPDGKTLAEEYAVRRSYVEQVLDEKRFPNKRTCIEEWRRDGVLDCDGDRPTRSRRIVPGSTKSEDVYVFRVYADNSDTVADDGAALSEPQRPPKNKLSKYPFLLADDDDEEGGEDNGSIA